MPEDNEQDAGPEGGLTYPGPEGSAGILVPYRGLSAAKVAALVPKQVG